MNNNYINIIGANQHNLKNINVKIPKNSFVVITGVSGSGKSSLAFNSIYAEAKRKYLESLSPYARQYLKQLPKPKIKSITGLIPSIAIEQKSSHYHPKSTVGTSTEIYDYIRILFSSVGVPKDPVSGKNLSKYELNEISQSLVQFPESTKVIILSPIKSIGNKKINEELKKYQSLGFLRARINETLINIEDIEYNIPIKSAELVIDRMVIRNDQKERISESIEIANKISESLIICLIKTPESSVWELKNFYTQYINSKTGNVFPILSPKHFSFNNPMGACEDCNGTGEKKVIDIDLVIPNKSLSIADNGIQSWFSGNKKKPGVHFYIFKNLAKKYDVNLSSKLGDLPDSFKKAILNGDNDYEGLNKEADKILNSNKDKSTKNKISSLLVNKTCPKCKGRRIKKEFLNIYIDHENKPLNIDEISSINIDKLIKWIDNIKLTSIQKLYISELVDKIKLRLNLLSNIGLEYLSLNRKSNTLSGGEAQRIQIATQLNSELTGILYVLDEPSIGLHNSDTEKLIETLKHLRNLGNSLIVVEHDEEILKSADHIIDIGPKSGKEGGYILSQGNINEIINDPKSISAPFLSKKRNISPDTNNISQRNNTEYITIYNAKENNLKNITVSFPINQITCITGVSGSGKSTLINSILYKRLKNHFDENPHNNKQTSIKGIDKFDKYIFVDQKQSKRSSKSNIATYLGIFDFIRTFFSQLTLSKIRGYKSGRFSFNLPEGQCKKCKGSGEIKIDMHFLDDVTMKCDLCNGKRYNKETLDVLYKGKNIHEVLDLSVEQSIKFFENFGSIKHKLEVVSNIGLSYIHLNQTLNTLSGGEYQRIKLATELSKSKNLSKTLYIFDEPTTGLHFLDIEIFLNLVNKLRNKNNTIIIVEHNMDVIKSSDWIIDMGPHGGEKGGNIVAEGNPETISKNKNSLTGKYLKQYLN